MWRKMIRNWLAPESSAAVTKSSERKDKSGIDRRRTAQPVFPTVFPRTRRARFRAAGSPLTSSRIYLHLGIEESCITEETASSFSKTAARLLPSYMPL